MSFRTNTLNIQSVIYDASTDTPPLSAMVDGGIYEVATSGKLIGTTIEGATVGADSYLLVGDKVLFKNGTYELTSPKIKNGTTINFGTGGLFTTLQLANDYISQRVYTGVILNQLSNTTETASVDVTNPCSGRLVIMGNGFTIDFSGTVGNNCSLSGNNIYIDNFTVTANHADSTLYISGDITHDNGLRVENLHATGLGVRKVSGANLRGYRIVQNTGAINTNANINILVSGLTNTAYFANGGGELSANNVTTDGAFSGGASCSNYILGAINTLGGSFNGGTSCSNTIVGAINTLGGSFNGGNSCSNLFGAINYGVGTFNCGISCVNTFQSISGTSSFSGGSSCNNTYIGAVTTGGGSMSCGVSSSNSFLGSVNTVNGLLSCGNMTSNQFSVIVNVGSGLLNFGYQSNNLWLGGASGSGGVDATGGSRNNCQGQPMPAGTPASGTNTAAFVRVN